MKTCVHCKTSKPELDFSVDRSTKDGLRRYCKECVKSLWYAKNKAREREFGRAPLKEEAKERERVRKLNAYRSDPAKFHAQTAKRRAVSKLAQPAWSDPDVMVDAYRMARELTQMTRTQWHVDHIVPLLSNVVCGLHNQFNLRVTPAAENLSKGNRVWPDMPA